MTTINSVNTNLSGQTGTGTIVGSISPTLVTPILGVAAATSINFGANSLSAYVTGTFTPVLTGSSGSATYTAQLGSYTTIGARTFFSIDILITGSTLAGNITITGLPVLSTFYSSLSIWPNTLGATATPCITALVPPSSTTIFLYTYTAGNSTQLTATNLGTTAQLIISGNYV